MNNKLNLKGFAFQELFTIEGLEQLDQTFLDFLQQYEPHLAIFLKDYREVGSDKTVPKVSEYLIRSSQYLENFLSELFDIEDSVKRMQAATLSDDPIFAFKKYFVLREAKRRLKEKITKDFASLDYWLSQQLGKFSDRELAVAQYAQSLLQQPDKNETEIDLLICWCVEAMRTEAGQVSVANWISFNFPRRLDYKNLVDVELVENDPIRRLQIPTVRFRNRDGFALTDLRMNTRQVMDEVHYCIYCHEKSGDFCSKGFPAKKTQPDLGLKENPLGEILTGCPLEEKISETHLLKKGGFSIAALAMVMIDNPMCPATGHRICNDCMKACIYQKQEPVNIPQIETRVLFDVLKLPWGVEIYDLLTRWNPLRARQYIPKPYNSLKVMVMGMGPAGFSLAHHLLMEGFAVVGVDGLKIEPLDNDLFEAPIHNFNYLIESLDQRVMLGFGGVAEYGITVRWDKNFLKLIYVSLLRRPYFQIFGSVRFGGTVNVDNVWEMGFDHLALALGAGLSRELRIPNSLAPGMRQANDFLMTLQLTGAAKKSSLANLQIRLPAVVIGGGLTSVDTATEVQAYYIVQVEKTLWRYETLLQAYSEEQLRAAFDAVSLSILDEFLIHGRAVRQERTKADREGRSPNFIGLVREWGGVTIAYRRAMRDSPAYTSNHEELVKALEEGIYYSEHLEPQAVVLDNQSSVLALRCRSTIDGDITELPARALFVATGAQPNVAYEYEYQGTFLRSDKSYQSFQLVNNVLTQAQENLNCKMDEFGVFTSYERDHHRVSFLGDTHPVFQGSVVKAIASAKRSYPKITDSLLSRRTPGDQKEYLAFRESMDYHFRSKVVEVKRHHDSLVELVVQSPAAAKNFKPGQFYRIQNYEILAPRIQETRLQTEALALLGIPRPDCPDQLSFMVDEVGVSARLVATFQPGCLLSVMGPTGSKSSVLKETAQTIMIIGDGHAIAYTLSNAFALHKAGHRILFVGIFPDKQKIYCKEQLTKICDACLWVEENFIDVLSNFSDFPISEIDSVTVVGATHLVKAVRDSKALKTLLSHQVEYTASVYGPMQCMLKGVCAQCLQWQIDPATGHRKKAVYSCSWQHQPIEKIDVENIDERLGQNRCQEILSTLWLDYIFDNNDVKHV